MIEIVDTVHSVLAYSDVIKHQTVHQALLHPPDDLLLAEDAGGDHGDVLEGEAVNISWFSPFLRVQPGLESYSESVRVRV